MPAIKLTKTAVESIPYLEKGQALYRDTVLKGFGVRVGRTKKAYFAEKRIDTKIVRMTIGSHGNITTEQARKEAIKLLAMMTTGHNPVDDKKEARAKKITLKDAFADFLKTRKTLKPTTIYDYERIMINCLADWQNKALMNISKDMVAKRHAKIGKENGEAYANLSMRLLRAIFNCAAGQYEDSKGNPLFAENPVKRLSQTRAWYRVKRRNTVIKPHELQALFEGLNQLRDTAITTKAAVVRDYIILLLLTGLRRQEGANLKWEDIDFKAKTLTVIETKNHEPLTLPLSDYLYDMLVKLHDTRINEYIFPGDGSAGHIVEPRRQIAKVTKLSGVSFTIHDLRRTFITIAESLDISAYAVKRLVNHKMNGDVTAGYIMTDAERLRKPMQRITDYILKVAGVKPATEVVDLDKVR